MPGVYKPKLFIRRRGVLCPLAVLFKESVNIYLYKKNFYKTSGKHLFV